MLPISNLKMNWNFRNSTDFTYEFSVSFSMEKMNWRWNYGQMLGSTRYLNKELNPIQLLVQITQNHENTTESCPWFLTNYHRLLTPWTPQRKKFIHDTVQIQIGRHWYQISTIFCKFFLGLTLLRDPFFVFPFIPPPNCMLQPADMVSSMAAQGFTCFIHNKVQCYRMGQLQNRAESY